MDVYTIHRFHLFFVENHLIGAERKRTILSLTVIITPFHFDGIEKNTTTICLCVWPNTVCLVYFGESWQNDLNSFLNLLIDLCNKKPEQCCNESSSLCNIQAYVIWFLYLKSYPYHEMYKFVLWSWSIKISRILYNL